MPPTAQRFNSLRPRRQIKARTSNSFFANQERGERISISCKRAGGSEDDLADAHEKKTNIYALMTNGITKPEYPKSPGLVLSIKSLGIL
jgi:hypothetical protein